MFKKVLYCIFAVLLGILVYMFATISIISGYQMDKIKEAAMAKDVDFFLGLTSYYNPTPVYQSAQGDPMDIRIYEIYQEASDSTSSDVGYLFLIFDIDENIATKADKVGGSKKEKNLKVILDTLDLVVGDDLVVFSSVTRLGVKEVLKKIEDLVG